MAQLRPMAAVLLLSTIALASAVSEAFYRISSEIDHAQSAFFPSEVLIEILNPKPPATHWYSVTIESHNRYSGRAKLLGTAPHPSDAAFPQSDSLVYSWKPPFSAGYNIIVHELSVLPNENDITVPFPTQHIQVQNKLNVPGPWGQAVDRMRMLPPCQNVQRMDAFTHWDGAWIGPDMHSPEDRLRNNWFFLPDETVDCKIETFGEREFRLLTEEKRIYIWGNSRERGIFLSLVDLLLDGDEKSNLESSVVGQCWGRVAISKQNMKVLYQDWRSYSFRTQSEGEPSVMCHNEKVVREDGTMFLESARKVWKEIFSGDKSTWPHVILMSTGNDITGFKSEFYDINEFVTTLPPDWDGTLFFTDGAFSATLAGRGHANDYEAYHTKLKDLTYSITHDKRVRWMDGMGWSKDMVMHGEFGPDHATISQHFHSFCDRTYEDISHEMKSMRICSNITENLAQLLIGHAIGPKAALMMNNGSFRPSFYSAEVVTCHHCPDVLLPFHITPYPEMKCYTGPLHPRSSDEISGHTQLCPKICMKLETQRQFGNPSNEIYERQCPYKYFPRGFQVGSDALRSGDGIGFFGHMVWVFNTALLTLVGYQRRAKIRGYMVKVIDPAGSSL